MVEKSIEISRELLRKGVYADLINARFIKPLDEECIKNTVINHDVVITLDELHKTEP